MSAEVKLQVLICTRGLDGLQRVADMALPQMPGVAYLVSCQGEATNIPQALKREDIDVHFVDSIGLSRNRNNAMSLATAPYVLLADDDLKYHADALRSVIAAFDNNPDIDIATFKMDTAPAKIYPPNEHDIFQPFKNYNIASVEIAFRLDCYRRAGLEFNENMGAGTKYMMCGEEDVVLLDAKQRGLRGRFFPITLCVHLHASTGTRLASEPGVLRAQGFVIARRYGFSRYPRLLLKAYRAPGNTLKNLFYLCVGASKIWKNGEK